VFKIITAATSGFLGFTSLMFFIGFLYNNSFHAVLITKITGINILIFDAILCLVFAVSHSILIRKSVKEKICRIVPEIYYGALFSITSAIILYCLMIFWQSGNVMIALSPVLQTTMQVIFFLAIAFNMWSMMILNVDVYGTKPLTKKAEEETTTESVEIIVKGPYKLVRHPLYFASLVMIWATPVLTTDRLLLNIILTTWIYFGTKWEEKDLVSKHGEQYVNYINEVPMLIPFTQFKKQR
jgi:methanethiol S-methyltransferase